MPFRVDLSSPSEHAFDVLIQAGALDIGATDGELAAILPDTVTREFLEGALGSDDFKLTKAVGRDAESVWNLGQREVRVGGLLVSTTAAPAAPGTLRLIDSDAFGTGHHPTTALCLEALEEMILGEPPDQVLDIGTGSGILALACLELGVERVVGLDIDPSAIVAAAENARFNGMEDRFALVLGGPEAVGGRWPLVIANILAAPLIDMASVLSQRVGSEGTLMLSGIASSLKSDVRAAYERCGMWVTDGESRDGWIVLLARPSW
jgi:ribosomal protein L11 methyltransferase